MILDLVALASRQKNPEKEQSGGGEVVQIIWPILSTILFVSAIALSWNCNKGAESWKKVLYAIAAGLFSHFYVIFYIVYRIALGNKCIN